MAMGCIRILGSSSNIRQRYLKLARLLRCLCERIRHDVDDYSCVHDSEAVEQVTAKNDDGERRDFRDPFVIR